jgi:hypothetical protein
MGLSPGAARGSTEPAHRNGGETDDDEGHTSGQDIAHVMAGFPGPGIVSVGFDVVANFTRGHELSPVPNGSMLGSDPMTIILGAFTLFHLAAGLGAIGAGLRLVSPPERAMWRSKPALLVAQVLCWVYPVLAFVSASWAWRAFETGNGLALPVMLAPIGWLFVMGLVFAIVDFAEDGIIGNARTRDPT